MGLMSALHTGTRGIPFKYPLAIPHADFGVEEPLPTLPLPWLAEVPGWYYVNQATGSDTHTYGSLLAPRATIPNTLPAGSKAVTVGSYTHSHTSPNQFVCQGTAANPVWILNGGTWHNGVQLTGSYTIMTGGVVYSLVVADPSDHMVLRDMEVAGDVSGGGVGVVRDFGVGAINDVVLLRLNIHDIGDMAATNDPDNHGITLGYCQRLWMLDCTMARCSGDGSQSNALANVPNNLRYLYIGRNTSYGNRQHGLWFKWSADVLLSENECYGHPLRAFGIGAQIGAQYGPQRLTLVNNYLHDGYTGLGLASYNIPGDVLAIGNTIENMQSTADVLDPNTGAGIFARGGTNIVAINNKMTNTSVGVAVPIGPSFLYLHGNSITGMARSGVIIENTASTAYDLGGNTYDTPFKFVYDGVLHLL